MNETITTSTEPTILTANCYFWSPAQSARSRRSNEQRHAATVAAWLRSLGLDVESGSGYATATGHGLAVEFTYRETCGNVYRHLAVTRAGKRSNITALRSLAASAAAA